MWGLVFSLIFLQTSNDAPGSRFCNFRKKSLPSSKSPILSTSVEKEATIIVKYTSRYRAALFQDVVKSGLRGDIQLLSHCLAFLFACDVCMFIHTLFIPHNCMRNLPHQFFLSPLKFCHSPEILPESQASRCR